MAVLGSNGVGKSSLLGALAGELPTEQGSIDFDGAELWQLNVAQQSRRRAVLPQQTELTFPFAVREVVAMGAYPFEEASPGQVTEWVAQALGLVDVTALAERNYSALSGGEQRRVQLARVLVQCLAMAACHGSVYLFLDEPLANLDPLHQLQLLRVLRQLAHERQYAILVIMHDLNLATLCDQIVLLSRQRLVGQGTPLQVLTPHNLRQVFDLDMSVIPHPLDPGRLLVLPHAV